MNAMRANHPKHRSANSPGDAIEKPHLAARAFWQQHGQWLGSLIVLSAALAAYWPAIWWCGYIWDDDDYLTRNIHLRSFDGLLRIWEPLTTKQYYPIVFTTFWIEYQLWQLNPVGYHLINVLLHAINAILVWRVCSVLRIPGAWLIGAVFALHPVHVESVAWVTERKNVLSGLFYLSSMLAFLRGQDLRDRVALARPSQDARHQWWWYGLSLVLFVLALLSKSVTCSLPAALILARLWQRRPVGFAFLGPLLPFFALGLLLALHTAHLERVSVGAEGAEFDFSFADRILIASNALLFYPYKLLIPWPLMFFYPRWVIDDSELISYWPVLAVVAVGAVTVVLWRRGMRGPFLALSYFAGTAFPALGFFNVYPMRYSFVADHFVYLASLGVIALAVAGLTRAIANPRIGLTLAGSVLLAFAVLIWHRCWVYQDEETLWRVTKHQNPAAWIAHINLGKLLTDRGDPARGDVDEAIGIFEDLIREKPDMRLARNHLAWAYLRAGRHDESLREYQALQQQYGGYETKLGQTYQAMNNLPEAERWYRAAIERVQEDTGAIVLLADLVLRQGRANEAVKYLEEYLHRMPQDAFAHLLYADALAAAGQFERAERAARHAIELAQWLQHPMLIEQGQRHLEEILARRAPTYQ